jgi:phenylalanyl-tRNA synthetase beta chain
MHLALFLTGKKHKENWIAPQTPTSFFELKSLLENILRKLGINLDKVKIEKISHDVLSDGLVYRRGDGMIYGELGFVHPKRLKECGIDVPVYYADIRWDFILQRTGQKNVVFEELPKFPSVRRDLALLIDESVTFAQLRDIALKTERKLLKEVDIFDVYKGEKLPAGKKSYALSFILRDDEKTLTDPVIEKIMNRLIGMFEKEAGAQLR